MADVFDKSAIIKKTFLEHVEVFETLGSTQDRALTLANDPSIVLPALVISERQTAGRGRSGSSWWSPEGALLLSLVLPLPKKFAEPGSSGQLSLTIARAIADYVQETLGKSEMAGAVRVKPPNDVYLADAKIAGLIIDVPHHAGRSQRQAIVGLGLNVNNDGNQSPKDVQVRVTSISEQTGQKHNMQQSLIALLGHIEKSLEKKN